MSITYHAPASWDEARTLLAEHGDDATVVAGGTAFTLLLRQGLIRPGHVVGLQRVPHASRIDVDAHGGIAIGAMTTHTSLEHADAIRRTWPELADAVAKVATVRVRNQATIGGSLAHADPASDAPVMLAALAAQALVVGEDGAHRVPVDELLVDTFTTSLLPTEVIRAVEVPARTPATRAVYLKYTLRSVDDYATVSVAARADMNDGRFDALRIFLGGVGPRPMRAVSVDRALTGQAADEALIADAVPLVDDDIDPIDDVRGSAAYKREMARVFTQRALTALGRMA
ncbi:MAG TPA: FAD binding domain-containing protein [Candidatus Limnocylindria bacterium]